MTVGQDLASIPCQLAHDPALLPSPLAAADLSLLHSLPGMCVQRSFCYLCFYIVCYALKGYAMHWFLQVLQAI